MFNLNTYKIGDLYSVASGLSKSRSEFGFGYPFVSFKDVFYNFFIPAELESLANTTEKERTTCSVKRGDIFLTRTSETMYELGMSAVALKDYENATFNGFTKRLRLKDKASVEIDPVFIAYYFRTTHIRNQIGMHATMTTRASLNSTAINSIEITIPEIEVQKRIGEILKSIDDKIEMNRRMKQTLELMAQTLFRQYFVDGINEENLPDGWKAEPLDEVANFLNGLALQKYKPTDEKHFLPIIKIRELKNGITSSTEKADLNIPSQYIIHDGDILFSWSGTLEADIWCNGDGALNQHLFKVTSDKFPKWFYYYWVKEHLREFQSIAASKATTMGHIKRSHLSEAIVFTSPEEHLRQADNVFAPLLDKIVNCKVEIRKLTQLRDTLLSKLMSGEIDVMQTKPEALHEPILS